MYNARISVVETKLLLCMPSDMAHVIMDGASQGYAYLLVDIKKDELVITLRPNRLSPRRVSAMGNLGPNRPFRYELLLGMLQPSVQEVLKRSMSMDIEMALTENGFSGRIDLACHRRPWPRLVDCKGYNRGKKALEVFRERLQSTIATGDTWVPPDRWFMDYLPAGWGYARIRAELEAS